MPLYLVQNDITRQQYDLFAINQALFAFDQCQLGG